MNNTYINTMLVKYPALTDCRDSIISAAEAIIRCYKNGGKLLLCGNGGSAADSDHIVGELMKSFLKPRPLHSSLCYQLKNTDEERGAYLGAKLQQGLPAISLNAHAALISAVANDIDADLVFAQQVTGYGKPHDVLIGISTSGNSQNVYDAMLAAKAMGLQTIVLTGQSGGRMKMLADILINVPAKETPAVQELHLPVYHALCILVEEHFFPATFNR
ncbi:MAG: SIS domain-containing protein [Chitinophagaceae bacterium]